MKVTLIKSELYKEGGLEKYTWEIAQDFCKLGVDVTLLTTGTLTPPFSDPHLTIVSLSQTSPLSFLNVIQFDTACDAYLKKHPTPIIFSLDRNRFQTHIRAGNGVHAAYLAHRAKEEGSLKQISFFFNPLHQTILSLEKKAFEHSQLQLLFTNSEMVKQEVIHYYNIDPQKICTVHNGVRWHALKNSFEQWEECKERNTPHSFDSNAFQFLFIGHNFRRKGLEKLLQALSLLKEEYFQLSIVGKEKNLNYFQQLAVHLGLEKKVLFFGPQKETLAFYQRADCLVIPSLYDPFANVTLEALSLGVPVLSSKNNGGHEILTPENGCLIESLDDSKSFSKTLKKTLDSPKTPQGARAIRESVKHLDFSNQLRLITSKTLESMRM